MPYAGPDSGHFSAHCWIVDWPTLVVAANALEIRLRREGRVVAADMVLRAYAAFELRLKELAITMSKRGTDELRDQEKRSRVRPDTLGEGGKRLGDFLFVEPLYPNLLPGAIGINDEEQLDNNVPWWITNEIGNDTRVGDRIFGLFFDAGGGSNGYPPDQNYSGQHALFQPTPARAGGGPGTIEEPIPAKGFIRKATGNIKKEWTTAATALQAQFDREIAIALVTYR